MRLQSWDNLEMAHTGIKVKVDDKSMGYLLVYDTLEEMFKDFPNETEYAQIEVKSHDNIQ